METKGLEKYDLKLEKERRYNLRDSGLTKLIFEGNSIDLVKSGFRYKIIDLKLNLGEYILISQTSENGYERLICPTYLLDGKFEDIQGSIYGVIRPHILENSIHPDIVPDFSPEFNFYIDTIEGDEVGKSIHFQNGKLICGVMDWTHLNQNEIKPHFNVNLKPNSGIVYFEDSKE